MWCSVYDLCRYTSRHPVSLPSWVLQPRADDPESGQLPALSSWSLLWEGETGQSFWKMQSRSVIFPSYRLHHTAVKPTFSRPSRLWPRCQACLSEGSVTPVQTGLADLGAGNEQSTSSSEYHTSKQTASVTISTPFQPVRTLLTNSLCIFFFNKSTRRVFFTQCKQAYYVLCILERHVPHV